LAELLDMLLRMQSAENWQQPLTLYLVPGPKTIEPGDALTLIQVLRVLRSPVRTAALAGLLQGCEPLILAAGKPGYRYVLPNTLVSAGPIDPGSPPLPKCPVGLAHLRDATVSPWEAVRDLLQHQLQQVYAEFNLEPLWHTPKILTAAQAIQVGLADAIVPSLSPRLEKEPIQNVRPTGPERGHNPSIEH
jgi:hypothetical protein